MGKPGEGGAWPTPPKADFSANEFNGDGRFDSLALLGNVPVEGVPGRTLTELCGERGGLKAEFDVRFPGLATELLDVDDALDSVWMWPG